MKRLVIILYFIISSTFVHAKPFKPKRFQDSYMCTQAVAIYERKYRIPKNLLLAITIAESGVMNYQLKTVLPWPWTMNVDGSPKMYQSMHEMKTDLEKFINLGITNIDVGCAQINYKIHQKNFKNSFDIVKPNYNTGYAAYLLYSLFKESKDWNKAISYYHSRRPEAGSKYLSKILTIWKKLNRDYLKLNNNIIIKRPPYVKNKRSNILIYNHSHYLGNNTHQLRNKKNITRPIE